MAGVDKPIKLWKHQRVALELIRAKKRFALLFDMGTGKTLTAIYALKERFTERQQVERTVLLVPKCMQETWLREIRKHCHPSVGAVTVAAYGSRTKKAAAFSPDAKIVIVNHDSLRIDEVFQAILDWKPVHLVVDEAHKYKNPKATRVKRIIRLTNAMPEDSIRLALTGTPVLKGPEDLWGVFRCIKKDIFDEHYWTFFKKYFWDANSNWSHKPNYFPKYEPKPGCEKELRAIIEPWSMRVEKKDVLDLPPFTRKTVYVDLTKAQKHHYEAMEREFITHVNEAYCEASLALTQLLRLMQICSGLLPTDKRMIQLESEEYSVLEELLSDLLWRKEQKAIIWTTFVDTFPVIESLLKKKGWRYCMIRGGQTNEERTKSVDDFNDDPQVRICVANPQAGGVGIGLQAAQTAIYLSRNYSLEDDEQSEARNYRGGSEIHKSVTRIDIVTRGTVEEEVVEALREKKNVSRLLTSMRKHGHTDTVERVS